MQTTAAAFSNGIGARTRLCHEQRQEGSRPVFHTSIRILVPVAGLSERAMYRRSNICTFR